MRVRPALPCEKYGVWITCGVYCDCIRNKVLFREQVPLMSSRFSARAPLSYRLIYLFRNHGSPPSPKCFANWRYPRKIAPQSEKIAPLRNLPHFAPSTTLCRGNRVRYRLNRIHSRNRRRSVGMYRMFPNFGTVSHFRGLPDWVG